MYSKQYFYMYCENLGNPLCSKVMPALYLAKALALSTLLSLWGTCTLHVTNAASFTSYNSNTGPKKGINKQTRVTPVIKGVLQQYLQRLYL
jgi:hypothetical protein